MITTNFITEKWDLIVLAIALLIPIIPPTWIGQDKTFYDNKNQEQNSKKLSVLSAFINLAILPLVNITAFLSLRGTVSLIIFLVIAVDLIYRKQLSREAVILVSIGIVALYLEQLIEKGKEFSFFGIIRWKGKDLLNKEE